MTTPITKEWLQKAISEMEAARDDIPFGLDEDGNNTLLALKMALTSLSAEPVGEVSEQPDGLVMDGTVHLGGSRTHRVIKGLNKMKRLPLGTKFYTVPPAPVCSRPVHPTISSEELDDETLDELIDFRRSTLEYHSQQGNKVQTIIHGVTLTALLELRERRAAIRQGNSPVVPDGWIPVSERMPETHTPVWCFGSIPAVSGKEFGFEGWLTTGGFVAENNSSSPGGCEKAIVTHWMPLSAAPQRREGDGVATNSDSRCRH